MAKNLLVMISATAAALIAILLLPLFSHRSTRRGFLKWGNSRVSADLVVMNATIYTSDPSLPFAESMAVRNGRILRVGDYDSIKDFIGHRTQNLNLDGKVVVPGFIDSHVHFLSGGLQMGRVELRDVKSQDEFVQKVEEAVREPTGLLVDSAMKLVFGVIPEVSINERRDALLRASKHALSKGVTTVVDVGRYFPGALVDHAWQDLSDVYMWADSVGKMLIRVCLFFPMQTWSRLAEFREAKGSSLSKWIYLGGVKAFADGSLGSNSALFHEPYEDDLHNYGLKVTDFEWLLNATLASDRAGLQVAVHAIGDKANEIVLDLFDTVASSNGVRDRRFRIEHAQHLLLESVIRFGQQRVIASVQPDHLLYDAGSAEKKIGIIRARKGSYLFQSLLASNAQIAFGSDWPVADINPLRGIQTAIARVPPGWNTPWIPTECVSLNDALKAYTVSAAYAGFLDHELGSLTQGKYADFVVLDAPSWDEFSKQDTSTRVVEATYVNGVQAYP